MHVSLWVSSLCLFWVNPLWRYVHCVIYTLRSEPTMYQQASGSVKVERSIFDDEDSVRDAECKEEVFAVFVLDLSTVEICCGMNRVCMNRR